MSVTKPPLGVTPKWLWIEMRSTSLLEAIERYKEAKLTVPPEWADELTEHLIYLKNNR